MFSQVQIGKIGLDILSKTELHRIMYDSIIANEKKIILHINARLVELAHTTAKWLVDYINSHNVDHIFCDGAGIQLAARITLQSIPEKITYNKWLWDCVKFCDENKFSIFLLGAKQDVAEKAIENIKGRYPKIRIMGHHGYFNQNHGHRENLKVIENINGFNPNILLVCFGMPFQEKWIKENAADIRTNIFLTGGGALDYVSSYVKTTPSFFSKLYLEWFYRLCQNPRRLWKRYLIGNLIFLAIVSKDFLKVVSGNIKKQNRQISSH